MTPESRNGITISITLSNDSVVSGTPRQRSTAYSFFRFDQHVSIEPISPIDTAASRIVEYIIKSRA